MQDNRTAKEGHGAARLKRTRSTTSLPDKRHLGKALYDQMRREVDYSAVIRTAVEDCGVPTAARADSALDAFLEWFSLIPTLSHDTAYVMLKGDIDRVFHAMIMHTALYRTFCERYIGNFVDHVPRTDAPPREWVKETLVLLRDHFGDELSPLFDEWRQYAMSRSPQNPLRKEVPRDRPGVP
jgi:hypothetical protein